MLKRAGKGGKRVGGRERGRGKGGEQRQGWEKLVWDLGSTAKVVEGRGSNSGGGQGAAKEVEERRAAADEAGPQQGQEQHWQKIIYSSRFVRVILAQGPC